MIRSTFSAVAGPDIYRIDGCAMLKCRSHGLVCPTETEEPARPFGRLPRPNRQLQRCDVLGTAGRHIYRVGGGSRRVEDHDHDSLLTRTKTFLNWHQDTPDDIGVYNWKYKGVLICRELGPSRENVRRTWAWAGASRGLFSTVQRPLRTEARLRVMSTGPGQNGQK